MSEARAFRRGLLVQLFAYAAATAVAVVVVVVVELDATWLELLVADVAATLIIFGFSVGLSNSSLYDPYWSAAPPLLGVAFFLLEGGDWSTRRALSLGLTLAWGARLTYSFFRGWPGLHHEDWRYRDLRAKTGRFYWLVSFLGIHLFPTALTFAGTVALFGAIASDAPLGTLDAVATALTAIAIAIEARADRELRDFVREGPPAGAILARGLWAYSRHPNYLGEVLFWWGLGIFAFAAGAPLAVGIVGPAAITLLFVFVSIPMIERRMRARRPGWREHAKRVPVLVPWRIGPFGAAPPSE